MQAMNLHVSVVIAVSVGPNALNIVFFLQTVHQPDAKSCLCLSVFIVYYGELFVIQTSEL